MYVLVEFYEVVYDVCGEFGWVGFGVVKGGVV